MKKLALAFILVIFLIGLVSAVDRLAEYYNTNDDAAQQCYGVNWKAQTFKVGDKQSSTINVSQVGLKLYRTGNPGIVNISIRATDVNNKPTGGDLAVGSINGNTINSTSPGQWYNISITPNIGLVLGTNYSIVIRAIAGDGSNYLAVRSDESSPTFVNGTKQDSATSGATWTIEYSQQLMFEVYNTTITPIISTLNLNKTAPTNNQILSTDGAYFNFTGTLTPNIYNFTNVTYFVWNSNGSLFNRTTKSLTFNNITNYSLFINSFVLGQNYNWNIWACFGNGSFNNCSWDETNFTFYNLPFTESYINYNSSGVYETSIQSFKLNISANPSVTSVSGNFYYDGTRYSTSLTDGSGGIYSATNNVVIPLQENSGTNKTFYWEFQFTLTDSSTIKSNSTIFTQDVERTFLISQFGGCNSTMNTTFLNFTTKSAENPFPIITATIKTALSWYVEGGDGSITRNYSFEDISEGNNTWRFCGYPNKTLITDATIEYDKSGYSINFYYLLNASLSNVSQNINLYLLNESKSTATILQVQTDTQKPVEDVYIQIQSYDVGTDTYYTVGMAKTDFNGKDIAYLNWYDTFYKYILIKNNQVIKIINPSKISESPVVFPIPFNPVYSYDKFENIVYSLTFNNDTKNFILTYSIPSGEVSSGCLKVIKRTPKNDTTICNVCETSSSATLYCNINAYGNGTFIATFYATGSLGGIDSFTIFVGVVNRLFDLIGNVDGTIYAILFAGIVMVMFFITPVLGIVGLILGMLGAMALGFQPLNYLEFVGIVLLGGIVIVLIKR